MANAFDKEKPFVTGTVILVLGNVPVLFTGIQWSHWSSQNLPTHVYFLGVNRDIQKLIKFSKSSKLLIRLDIFGELGISKRAFFMPIIVPNWYLFLNFIGYGYT